MRWIVASIVVHALLVGWLVASMGDREPSVAPAPAPPPIARTNVDQLTAVVFVDEPAVKAGGGGTSTSTKSARHSSAARRAADAWAHVSVHVDDTAALAGGGAGTGTGAGTGSGIGFGDGGGVRVADEVPRPPPPPPVSRARAARLVWPTRDEEVDDDANLFVARITVDEDGDVVGAHMIKTTPGARAERAADAIWQFRYAPALDDRGVPTRSTFDQPFQVR